MTVLMIIFSVLMILCGINCLVTPMETFSALGWIAGVSIIVAGVSAVCRYAAGRSGRSVWELVGGVAGILVGVLVTVNSFAQFAANLVIAYAAALWLVVYGIGGMAEALTLKDRNQALPDAYRTASWLVVMLLGLLTTVLGVVCVFQPMITALSVGLLIGVSILVSGIKTLVLAVQIMKVV